MKKVCIVVPPNLPMPPVKGGAIETLMQYIAEVNEIEKKLDITFISLWNKTAEKEAQKYKNSKYVYYHWKKIDNLRWFIFRCIRKIFGRNFNMLEPYEHFVSKYVLNNSFDIFVNESADFKSFKKISQKLGKNNCYAHLHSRFASNKVIDETFGTIISVSQYIKREWLKTATIDEKNVVVLENCVDRQRFSKVLDIEERKKFRNQIGLTENDFVVYFCGRIVPEKGILELINAIISIKNKRVKLLIIGSPNFGNEGKATPYLVEVKRKVESNSNRIIFTGYVDNCELYKYYSISDCVVVPSTYEDPAPLVPIESMMAGKALIITNTGGAPEYVTANSAIIVNKENDLENQLKLKICELKENVKLRKSMEVEAENRAILYTKEQYYYNFVNIIGKDIK